MLAPQCPRARYLRTLMILKDNHSPSQRYGHGTHASSPGGPLTRRARLAWARVVWTLLVAALLIAVIAWGKNFWQPSSANTNGNGTQLVHLKQPPAPAKNTPSTDSSAPAAETAGTMPAEPPGAKELETWKKAECSALNEELTRIEASFRTAPPAQQNDLIAKRRKTLDQLMRLQC